MIALLRAIAAFSAVHLLLFGCCVAEGLLLHWLIPSVDLGIAIVATTIGTFGTALVLTVALSQGNGIVGPSDFEEYVDRIVSEAVIIDPASGADEWEDDPQPNVRRAHSR